ncbi:MAG TPA: glycine hydroxymethyltransferase [Streptosporangiaceae bacterium]
MSEASSTVDVTGRASQAWNAALDVIAAAEPGVAAAIRAELADQRSALKLIASENYASPAVLLAMGNWLSDKYAEGTIGRRMYAGCQNVDAVEQIAADHARALFGADHAYVQPHSGIDANLVAFWAVLAQRIEVPALAAASAASVDDLTDAHWAELRRALGDQRMIGMSLDAGGHLTHGFRRNISGKMFDQRSYGTDPASGLLDYAQVRALARGFRPLIIIAGYSAYPRLVNFAVMREIADEVGATLMVDMAHFAGLVAGGVLTGDFDPVPHASIVTSTTHKSLRGPRGGLVLCEASLAEHVDRGCPMVLGGPLPQVMAAKAVALAEARQPAFGSYARQIVVNAASLADGLLRRGATLVTGGTDNHLVLLDTRGYGISGRQAESALLDSGIVTNRNSIPADPNGPWYTSGVRLGTPALTTLGMGPAEMDEIADMIVRVLAATTAASTDNGQPSRARYALDPGVAGAVRGRARDLLAAYPLYPEITLA